MSRTGAGTGDHFTYSPLDYQTSSIRVLRIRPGLSPAGHIQCEMQNATINSTYFCLSYVWGNDDVWRLISINGYDFTVRENLWQFLRSAKDQLGTLFFKTPQDTDIDSFIHEPPSYWEWIWVDAICIDQSNTIERTQQVQQMGDIYSCATGVIAWLGADEHIATALRYAGGASVDSAGLILWEDPINIRQLHPQRNSQDVQRMLSHLWNSPYWDRAWITQEVTLARDVSYMACGVKVRARDLLNYWDLAPSKVIDMSPRMTEHLKAKSLIFLMRKFMDKKCSVARDRVFSLLAICGDGSSLQVDYDLPHKDLIGNVLQSSRSSFCLCAIQVVGSALEVEQNSPDVLESSTYRHQPFAMIRLPTKSVRKFTKSIRSRPSSHQDVSNVNNSSKYTSSISCTRHVSGTGQTTTIVTLGLQIICAKYNEYITLSTNPAIPGFTYHFHRGYMTEQHRKYGCNIKLDEDASFCTLEFSLEFLLEIASRSEASGDCCDRVVRQESYHGSSVNDGALQLCVNL